MTNLTISNLKLSVFLHSYTAIMDELIRQIKALSFVSIVKSALHSNTFVLGLPDGKIWKSQDPRFLPDLEK